MKHGFENQVRRLSRVLFLFFLLFLIMFSGLFYLANRQENQEVETEITIEEVEMEGAIENGIHVSTGFVDDDGMLVTIQNCTNCHSAKLVTQNRMSREGWEATIKWMQETQNLWDLGTNQELILSYLSKNYAPLSKGRRQQLNQTEWYQIE